MSELEKAKSLIRAYLESEFGECADDLSEDIGLAYTTLSNPEIFRKRGVMDFDREVEVRVNCNINDLIVVTFVNNVPLRMERYDSLKQMNDNFLSFLDFDDLVFLDCVDWACIAEIIRKQELEKTERREIA